MTRLPNPVNEAAAFARQAQQQLSELQRAMKAAEDSIAGLNRAIKDPVIKTPRQRIKGSKNSLSPLESLGASLLNSAVSSGISSLFGSTPSGSFGQSSAQRASSMVSMTLLGQRVR